VRAPALDKVVVRNVYFDVTPAAMISYWIDETGVHSARD
jgi:translation initiation factor 2B subunit (eIF-2B alpha/beta/delta family)